MSTRQSENPDFRFLSDEAIREIKNDRLKHPSIAEALKNIVVNCPLPFTVGLFGKWGTGKSTIAHFLKSKLNEQKEKIALVDFDIWKYEEDSLRRYFLINLVAQLKEQKFLPDDFELDERVESSTSRSFEGALKISWAKVLQLKLYLLLCLGAVVVVGILTYFISNFAFQAYLATVFSVGFTTSAILFLFQIGSEIFTTETKTLSQERLKDAYEFEEEFGKIVNSAKTKRILIIIDNLDRCTHSKAVELLSTIKTFLEPKSKKCIFLIQCDEDAIKKHLESVYLKNEGTESKNTAFDADEFLRKFFNTSIKIPPFIDVDLEEYTKELLQETGVSVFHNNPDLISAITQAFRENPRQIKQFINTLLSYYLVALERESGNDPVIKLSGIITGNPAFLAKFLIIRKKWPKFYKAIIENPKKIGDYASQEADIKNFMGGTRIIKTDNIRVFIYLKQSARRLRLPGGIGDDLEIALEDNKADDVIRILKELKAKGTKDNEVTDFITELIQKNKGKQQNLINIINLTAHSRKEVGLEVQPTFCEEIAKVISSSLLSQLHTLDLDFTFFAIRGSRTAFREPIISHYVGILGRAKDAEAIKQIPDYPKYVLELAAYINSNRELFTSKKKDVRTALTNAHFDNIDVLAVFEKNESAINDFVTPELLTKLVGSITEPDLFGANVTEVSLFNKKLEFVLNCKNIVDSEVIEATIEKLTTLLTAQNNTPETPQKESAVKQILEKTEQVLKDYSTKIQDKQKADVLSDALVQGIGKYGEFEKKSLFLPALLYLNDKVSDSKKPQIEQTIKSFVQTATLPVIESFFTGKGKGFQQLFFQATRTDLEARSLKDWDILYFIWELEDKADRNTLLVKLLGTPNYSFALKKLEEENYEIAEPKNIVNLLLDKAPNLAVPERALLFDAVNKMECAKDKELREKYAKLLKTMIINQNATSQEVAFNAYVEAQNFLPHLLKLPLTVAIIDWLSSLDPVNINHKFALKTAFLYWDKISNTHKDNLITIVLDRIIAKTSKVEEVNMAFDILYSIRPGYTKYKPHYDIALSRANSEQNPPLMEAIKTGLKKLKPQRAKLKNSFWGRVNKL